MFVKLREHRKDMILDTFHLINVFDDVKRRLPDDNTSCLWQIVLLAWKKLSLDYDKNNTNILLS